MTSKQRGFPVIQQALIKSYGATPILNRLLGHKRFPALITQIKAYFYDEVATGIIGVNEMFGLATASLEDLRKEQPEKSGDEPVGDTASILTQQLAQTDVFDDETMAAFKNIAQTAFEKLSENTSWAQGDNCDKNET